MKVTMRTHLMAQDHELRSGKTYEVDDAYGERLVAGGDAMEADKDEKAIKLIIRAIPADPEDAVTARAAGPARAAVRPNAKDRA